MKRALVVQVTHQMPHQITSQAVPVLTDQLRPPVGIVSLQERHNPLREHRTLGVPLLAVTLPTHPASSSIDSTTSSNAFSVA